MLGTFVAKYIFNWRIFDEHQLAVLKNNRKLWDNRIGTGVLLKRSSERKKSRASNQSGACVAAVRFGDSLFSVSSARRPQPADEPATRLHCLLRLLPRQHHRPLVVSALMYSCD